ncbi:MULTISPECIES: hypothetical protein [Nitrobacteraceae]|jgi:hypothetical protein|uniref:Uncharacterized protein n=1 Tax=Afipia massiliensis TaxID=211460 RepID=A0A840N4T4_9BRAD|nr:MULTISPECIES: hypothetical protein [Nitrobacteraceae]MBB5052858.1 hypothetical protein [Afipia massiliensis]MCF2522039.1 hypothetical protein [Bradyrhizobium sp. G127]
MGFELVEKRGEYLLGLARLRHGLRLIDVGRRTDHDHASGLRRDKETGSLLTILRETIGGLVMATMAPS